MQARGVYMQAPRASEIGTGRFGGRLCFVVAASAIGEMLPALEVAEVVLVAVGFLFEVDVAVGLCAVAVLEEQNEPFDAVPEEEGQVEQFLLLGGMNEFVVELLPSQRTDREDEAKQTDGQEVPSHGMPFDEVHLMLLVHHPMKVFW